MDTCSAAFRDEAIPLITLNTQTNKFTISDEGQDFLKSVRGPVGIVSVAGLYRTGKSYLLNRMILNRSGGFGVGPTINPCTKGLWIWGKPVLGRTATGESLKILVIDSEGIGALDQDSTHDSRIFALSVLLSSCFLYNSVGSIDESSIENLSLVVNLSKNIQIHANSASEVDTDDYAKYFPTFIWVVRDFTLQLVDSAGEEISSKKYLEKALEPQNGFSDQVEHKNRIRRLLNSFFPEKECFTLVRPMLDEQNLQKLETVDFDQLRPEFVEQMMTLRKHILTKIKPKQIDGKRLDGPMFLGLIQSYVNAINNGSVPNIQNAWTYVCESQCRKALEESIELYDKQIKSFIQERSAVSEAELDQYSHELKIAVLETFREKAVGDSREDFERMLKDKIRSRQQAIRLENERESNRACQSFITKEFANIHKRLKSNDYTSFIEYERELRSFHGYFLENGPNGPNHKTIILDFLKNAISEGAEYFVSQLQHELNLQKGVMKELQKNLEQQLSELKRDNLKERDDFQQRLRELETERADFENRETLLQEEIERIGSDRLRFEEELRKELNAEKEALVQQIEELSSKMISNEEALKENQTRSYLIESEFKKERALLLQKVEHYEKSFEEMTSKEKELSNDLKNTKKEHTIQIKEMSTKSDSITRSLQQRIRQLEDKISEIENEVRNRDQQLQFERRRWETNDIHASSSLGEAHTMIENLQKELTENRELFSRENKELREKYEGTLNDLRSRISKLEETLASKEDNYKAARSGLEKEKALLVQKVEFLEIQLEEVRSHLAETKKAYKNTLSMFESQKSGGLDEKVLNELKEAHKSEILRMENEFNTIKKRLTQQIESLNDENGKLESRLQAETSDIEKELQSLRHDVQLKDEQLEKLNGQLRTTEEERAKAVREVEEKHAKTERELENKLETANQRHQHDISQIQNQSEKSLNDLKDMFRQEKEKLETRVYEEKEKNEEKLTALTEEYETRMKEELQNHEEEVESLREELREREYQLNTLEQQHEQELSLKQQSIDTLERHLQETRDTINQFQNSNSASLEQHLKNFADERTKLMSKIENLTMEILKKEKEISLLQKNRDQEKATMLKKETLLDKERNQLAEDKKSLNEKLEDIKIKNQKLNEDNISRQVEYGRELALSKQQSEFLGKKIEEQQRQIDDMVGHYEEKLRSQRQEFMQELNEKLEKAKDEVTGAENKYERVKKSLKEIEGTYNGQLSQLEKEKTVLHERLIANENKKAETEKKLHAENQGLSSQVYDLKEQLKECKAKLTTDGETLRSQYATLDLQYNELLASYERDKTLWEGKFTFLEQQKNQSKLDLSEAQKNFEASIQQFHQIKNSDKENKTADNALMATVESRHQRQIEELNENHRVAMQELESKVRRLEKSLKLANDKKSGDQSKLGKTYYEKKVIELTENEKKLRKDLDKSKESKDAKLLEFQRQYEKEKQGMSEKIEELDQKFKESEARKCSLIFEHEKERAVWHTEKDSLINLRNELQDTITRLEKRLESLLRENEKFKVENKTNRRTMNLNAAVPTANILLTRGSVLTSSISRNRLSSPMSSTSTRSALSDSEKLKDLTNLSGTKPFESNKKNSMNRSSTEISD